METESQPITVALPGEILCVIGSFLDQRSLRSFFLTCRAFHSLYYVNHLWSLISEQRWNRSFGYKELNWRDYVAEKICYERTEYKIEISSVVALASTAPLGAVVPRMHHTTCNWNDRLVIVGGEGSRNFNLGDVAIVEVLKVPSPPPNIYYGHWWDVNVPFFEATTDVNAPGEPSETVYLRVYQPQIKNMPEDFAINGHSCSLIDNCMWIFGGLLGNPSKKTNKMFKIDLNRLQFEEIVTKGTPPSCRCDFGYATVGRKIYIFGGSDATVTPMNDLYVFDTDTTTWSEPKTKGKKPSPRSAHRLESIGGKIYLFGGGSWTEGKDFDTHYWNIFVYDTARESWEELEVRGTPPNSSTFPGAFDHGQHIWVIGGGLRSSKVVSEDCCCFDSVLLDWTNVTFSGRDKFLARDSLSATRIGEFVFLYGGNSGVPFNRLQIMKLPAGFSKYKSSQFY